MSDDDATNGMETEDVEDTLERHRLLRRDFFKRAGVGVVLVPTAGLIFNAVGTPAFGYEKPPPP